MDEWDQNKLEEVVNKKHAAHNSNKTDIVCKYFIDAVENRKYGWFWDCPNGLSCKYRHALPPGYVLKKDRQKEEVVETDVVEEIEEAVRLITFYITKISLHFYTDFYFLEEKIGNSYSYY